MPVFRCTPRLAVLLVALLAVPIASAACDTSGGGRGLPGPTADFSASPLSGYAPLEVTFTDKSKFAGTWEWDFTDDGTPDSTSQNPTFTYTTPGTYSVTLTITGNLQTRTITKTAYITVLSPPIRIDVDANRTGVVDEDSGGVEKDAWSATHGAIYQSNLDNDSSAGNPFLDLVDTVVNGSADALDLARVVLRQVPGDAGAAGGTATVTVNSPARQRVRIFRNFSGTWSMVYDPDNPNNGEFTVPINDLLNGDVELGVECRWRHSEHWNARLRLTFVVRDKDGVEIGRDHASLWLAPWIMASNLWPVEQLIIGDFRGSTGDNTAFYNLCQTVCAQAGIQFVTYPGVTFGGDRWIQDSQEPGVILTPGPNDTIRRMDVTLQMPRNRPADDWCLLAQPGPDFGVMPKLIAAANSLSYGGNLELVPPMPGSPWGRIVTGGSHDGGPGSTVTGQPSSHGNPAQHPLAYKDFYNTSGIQAPVDWVSSEWLLVGHIDEFSMFVPASNTSRGWVLLLASADMSLDLIDQMPSSDDGLTVFAGRGTHQTTVSGIKADTALHQFNAEVQVRLDLIRARYKASYGFTDADIIEVPGSYESLTASNDAAAYHPGMVNLIVLPLANGDVHFIVPDPEGPQGNDVWRDAMESALLALGTSGTMHVHFADVFDSYHTLLGEAHCGSNTVRTPPANQRWWEE